MSRLQGSSKPPPASSLVFAVLLLLEAGVYQVGDGRNELLLRILVVEQELVRIDVLVVVLCKHVSCAIFAVLRKSEDGGTVPKWLAVVAVAKSAVLALVCAHSYLMAADLA